MLYNNIVDFISANIFTKFLVILFFHFIGDYVLQVDVLAKLKDVHTWLDLKKENDTKPESKRFKIHPYIDWIWAMLAHCLIWSFCVHFPILLLGTVEPNKLALSIYVHTLFHFLIDSCKCNTYNISMTTDQICHLIQIIAIMLLII